jgi:hypothetical protein
MKHRLAWLTKGPPVTRRAMLIRWTNGFHLHLLLSSEWPEGMRYRRFHPYSSAPATVNRRVAPHMAHPLCHVLLRLQYLTLIEMA